MKLIKVFDGVYRNESGGVKVFRREWQDKALPWVVCWEDVFSTRHEKRFKTLGEVREYLQQGY